MVGAGVLVQPLVGIGFDSRSSITASFMLVYVIFGGMLATTWVQIIKAVLLMSRRILLTVWSCWRKFGFNPFELFSAASDKSATARRHTSQPGLLLSRALDPSPSASR